MKPTIDRTHQPVEGNLRKAYRAPPSTPEPRDLARLLARLGEALEQLDRDGQDRRGGHCH